MIAWIPTSIYRVKLALYCTIYLLFQPQWVAKLLYYLCIFTIFIVGNIITATALATLQMLNGVRSVLAAVYNDRQAGSEAGWQAGWQASQPASHRPPCFCNFLLSYSLSYADQVIYRCGEGLYGHSLLKTSRAAGIIGTSCQGIGTRTHALLRTSAYLDHHQ